MLTVGIVDPTFTKEPGGEPAESVSLLALSPGPEVTPWKPRRAKWAKFLCKGVCLLSDIIVSDMSCPCADLGDSGGGVTGRPNCNGGIKKAFLEPVTLDDCERLRSCKWLGLRAANLDAGVAEGAMGDGSIDNL